MQVAELKTRATANKTIQKKRQPFFSKDGQDGFFSKSTESKASFFSPATIQPKLTIGQPNDKYEVEADAMADKVVQRLSNSEKGNFDHSHFGGQVTTIQPKCAECEEEEKLQKMEEPLTPKITSIQRKPIFESDGELPGGKVQTKSLGIPILQTKCAACEEEKKLQRKEDDPLEKEAELQAKFSSASDVEPSNEEETLQAKSEGAQNGTPDLESRLNSSRGGGSTLSPELQNSMGSAFGADFSSVRVHTGHDAVQMNNELGAKAFTHGSNIYFNEGKYRPKTSSGKHLLAHELTHTVQQTSPSPRIQKQGPETNLDRLNEMLNRFDVPEEDVIRLCGELNDTEKQTVGTGSSYKNKMSNALNVSEMIRAVNNLGLSLERKLEWVHKAATFGTTFMAYSEIKGMITVALQTERNTLKTSASVGRDFFIGVCTNETMVEALNDLQFDLVTKLTWLKAEIRITSWELDYPTIKPWITHATTTQAERDALKTHSSVGRDFFIGVCTNETMVEALNDLKFDLVTKLSWLKAEIIITSWELEYPTIKPWITHANTTQAERDALKTNASLGLDFFVDVCTNVTMVNALDDLLFDILTTIEWLLAETSASSIDYTWLCNKFKAANAFPAGEDVIACAIMERDIRDGNFNLTPDHTPAGWITRAHKQKQVADEMGGMVGDRAKWRGSGPGSGTTFEAWASASVQGPTPTLGVITVINCWEMIMLAAFRSGVLSWSRIHAIYSSGSPDWGGFLVNELSFSKRIPYDPSGPTQRPAAGDIVFFDGAAHVALGVGTLDGGGRTQIYSFWPPPNTAFTAGGTLDDVKITTIEELNDYWVGHGKPAFNIEFATANWG